MKRLTDKDKYLDKEKTKINTALLDVDDVHINYDDYPDFCDSFIISAIWLNKEFDKLIIDTFSISIYIIGLALLFFGLIKNSAAALSTTKSCRG